MITIGKKRALRTILLIVFGFLLLTFSIKIFPSSWIDLELSEEIQEEQTPLKDFLMNAVSWFGQTWNSIAVVSLTSLILAMLRFKREAFFCLLTLLMGVITYGIKVLIDRPRPNEDLVRVIDKAKFQSFPSGHVGFYIVFFGLMAFFIYHGKWFSLNVRRVLISVCMLFIFTVPVSRIYLGAHWFTDVLGGFLTGSIYLIILIFAYLGNPKTTHTIKKEKTAGGLQ